MAQFQHLCMNCLQQIKPTDPVCPHCGYDNALAQSAPFLQKGEVLFGRYLVGRVIRTATDAVTYVGQDLQTLQTVHIFEYLPQKLLERRAGDLMVNVRSNCELLFHNGLQAFTFLWQTLQTLATHAALPQVQTVQTANGTAYAVCAALDCISLKSYMQNPENKLDWPSCAAAFKPLFRALCALHEQGIVHGAISSSSVFVGADGKLHLGGFSIPQTKTDLAAFSTQPEAPFAPIELTDRSLHIGAYSDVYAVMAVFYLCLTGKELPDANARAVSDDLTLPVDIARTLPPEAIDTLYAALQLYPSRRIRTAEQLMQRLYPQPAAPAVLSGGPGFEETDIRLQSEDEALLLAGDRPEKKEGSASLLGLQAFLAILVIGTMLFCTLYSTVLYERMDIPLLDSILAPLTFLPINNEEETTAPPTRVTKENETAPEMVTVPNFMSLSYSDITGNVTFARNFDLRITFEENETVRKNAVIRQSVSAGERVAKGTTVTVTISSGKPTVELRDVIGLSYIDAYEMLTDDGFEVRKVLLENDGTHQAGVVYTMSLVAGLSFEKGTSVTLSVWDATGLTD